MSPSLFEYYLYLLQFFSFIQAHAPIHFRLNQRPLLLHYAPLYKHNFRLIKNQIKDHCSYNFYLSQKHKLPIHFLMKKVKSNGTLPFFDWHNALLAICQTAMLGKPFSLLWQCSFLNCLSPFFILFQMKLFPLILALLLPIFLCDCPQAQYVQFRQKRLDHPFPIISNPYLNPSQQYLAKVQENLHNKQRVCAIKYLDDSKKNYSIANFNSRSEAEAQGWIVTHQGICGKCSTLKDLFVYLTTDLTRPVRSCGVRHFASHSKLRTCIKSLGFTDACTEVWLWNTLNTKKTCGLICMISLILHRPYVINGELNKCLQCDQDKSGPIFKYQSGRTRRNSGIKSQIDRPVDQIYSMTHCYY